MARGIVNQETGDVTITAGAGKYYPSVSHYQTGSVNSGSLIGLYTKDVAVTFDTPMPDGDYIVTFDINIGSTTSVITGLEAANKTPTGFTARFFIKEKSASSTDQTWTANWQAFKLVTDKSAQYAEDKIAALESTLAAIGTVYTSAQRSEIVTGALASKTYTFSTAVPAGTYLVKLIFGFESGPGGGGILLMAGDQGNALWKTDGDFTLTSTVVGVQKVTAPMTTKAYSLFNSTTNRGSVPVKSQIQMIRIG